MVKFNPPVEGLTEQECNDIMYYMVLYHRQQDVEYTVDGEDWYIALTEDEKQKVLFRIAELAQELIIKHGLHYQIAINEAIERLGYGEE